MSWSLEETYCNSDSSEIPSADAGVKNSLGIIMAPQSWILYRLKMYKIPDEVIQFIEKTMKTWTVELTIRGKSLVEVNIQRSIFQ